MSLLLKNRWRKDQKAGRFVRLEGEFGCSRHQFACIANIEDVRLLTTEETMIFFELRISVLLR